MPFNIPNNSYFVEHFLIKVYPNRCIYFLPLISGFILCTSPSPSCEAHSICVCEAKMARRWALWVKVSYTVPGAWELPEGKSRVLPCTPPAWHHNNHQYLLVEWMIDEWVNEWIPVPSQRFHSIGLVGLQSLHILVINSVSCVCMRGG